MIAKLGRGHKVRKSRVFGHRIDHSFSADSDVLNSKIQSTKKFEPTRASKLLKCRKIARHNKFSENIGQRASQINY